MPYYYCSSVCQALILPFTPVACPFGLDAPCVAFFLSPPDRRPGSATPFSPQQPQMLDDATACQNRVGCSVWSSRTLASCLTREKVQMMRRAIVFISEPRFLVFG